MLVISFATGTQRTLELSVTLLIIFHYLDLQAIFVTVINCPLPQLTANSLTSVGGTDACGQLCYWDPKDH